MGLPILILLHLFKHVTDITFEPIFQTFSDTGDTHVIIFIIRNCVFLIMMKFFLCLPPVLVLDKFVEFLFNQSILSYAQDEPAQNLFI